MDKIIVDRQYFDELVSMSDKNPEISIILERIIRSHEENEKGRKFIKRVEQDLRDKGLDI